MSRYFYCDNCETTVYETICPNCFLPAREVDINYDCIECGRPYGECVCTKENVK